MDTQKLKIACVFEGDLQDGGAFQTQLSTISELNALSNYEIVVFTFSTVDKKVLTDMGLKYVQIENSIIDKILRILIKSEWFSRFKFRFKTNFEKKLDYHGIDLVYFLSPSLLALDLLSHSYIFTIWDLCHRENPEFPEVSYFREFEIREMLYRRATKKAIAVITDSELGKKNSVNFYNLDEKRIFNASFTPSLSIKKTKFIDIKEKYKINGDYIFYPAQFWAHKNHIYIIDAIKKLKDQGIILNVIFSGSDKGNLKYVLDYAEKQNIMNLIKYIGFAPNSELYYLYKQSLALVMPTYFGPTNIPPLEAFSIGTPVIYSDLIGLREQVADAALLCDLNNPDSLVDHLKLLIKNPDKRIFYIEKGYIRLNELKKDSIFNILIKIFDDFSKKSKCWKY